MALESRRFVVLAPPAGDTDAYASWMATTDHSAQLRTLRKAYERGDLVLYLGAGVSVGSELPTWEHLVAAMYFSALTTDSAHRAITQAYPNYLLAIAKWYLGQRRAAMDISARKIRAFYERERQGAEFPEALRRTLYSAMLDPDGYRAPGAEELLIRNDTLQAVGNLLAGSRPGSTGVRAVVTYNYDNLLELTTDGRVGTASIWRAKQRPRVGRIPIYHVHGYVPLEGKGSRASELIFSEEQFNAAANRPYHWSNVIQLQYMNGSVGLSIGLSLTDRNMRRLLDVARDSPLPPQMYAVVREEPGPKLTRVDSDRIRKDAAEFRSRFAEAARMKIPQQELQEVGEIVRAVHYEDQSIQQHVLGSLGVTTVAIDNYDEIVRNIIPGILGN